MDLNDQELTKRYYWEFVRRNPRYGKDFQALTKKLGMSATEFDRQYHQIWLEMRARPWATVEQNHPGLDLQAIKEGFIELGRFKEKWGVIDPSDPGQKEPPDFLMKPASQVPVVEVLESSPDAETNDDFLVLRVNVHAPFHEIERHLKDTLSVYQKIIAQNANPEFRNPRWTRFDDYLRVYDEVVQSGRTVEEAAKRFFPDFDEKAEGEKQPLLSHVETLLREAKRLVDLAPEIDFSSEE